MNKTEAMAALKRMGTAQNRKVYARHGVCGGMFGVSYANLGKLSRQIKVDHELALSLWATGNHDARTLATMIADPLALDARTLGAWAKDCTNHGLTCALGTLVARSPAGLGRIKKWIKSRDEWVGSVGWNAIADVCRLGQPAIDRPTFESWLETIEERIHRAKNRTRYSMNSALIAIGTQPGLMKKAIAAAKRIGPVEVDHGETGCKTPDAASYIEKAVAHQKAKAERAAKKKRAS